MDNKSPYQKAIGSMTAHEEAAEIILQFREILSVAAPDVKEIVVHTIKSDGALEDVHIDDLKL